MAMVWVERRPQSDLKAKRLVKVAQQAAERGGCTWGGQSAEGGGGDARGDVEGVGWSRTRSALSLCTLGIWGPFDFLCFLKWDGARLSRCLCRRKFYSRVNIPHDCFLVLQKVHTSVSLSVGSFLELSWVRRRRDESVSEREKKKLAPSLPPLRSAIWLTQKKVF